MGSRIVKVFYDQSCYPFKDSERTVRYPITGSSFAGSSNVNELHFYVRDIGGVNNLSWVAIVKLPNGKILYQVLTDIHLDSEINEYYVTFNLSQFYTQLKGDIYISLNGCLGEVTITTDEETDISTIQGEIDSKTVVATGAVKFSINYTPQRPIGFSFDLDQYQTIINALANKANIVSTIQVIADITTEDLSAYDNGQKFFSLADNTYYEKIATSPYYQLVENNSGVLASERLLVKCNIPVIGVLKDIAGEKGLVIYSYNNKDYLISFDASDLTNIKGCAFDLFDRCFYYAENLVVANNIGLLINSNNKIEHLDVKHDINCVYATDGGGNQIMLPYSVIALASALVKRDANGQVVVPLQPTSNEHAASKKYIDDIDYALRQIIDNLVRNAFINVDTTEYPTLQSFLASEGEEGFIYLYPVNISDLSKGYYQYIWENNQWQDLGTTQIDLSNYYTKSETSSLLFAKLDKRVTSGLKAYTHNGANQGDVAIDNNQTANTIPLRDGAGNIKVGTPSNNNDAASKYYVDVLGNLKVNKVSTINQLYGTSSIGFQITYTLETGVSGVVARRDNNGQLIVPQSPTTDDHATSKKYVDTSIANAISNVYKIKGSKTVAQINALTGMEEGDVYNVLDSGTITLGNLQVFTGDNIVWTGSAWDKLGAEIDWSAYDEKFIAAGFFEVQPYNESTGEITFVYSTELYIMSYDDNTGIMTISAN